VLGTTRKVAGYYPHHAPWAVCSSSGRGTKILRGDRLSLSLSPHCGMRHWGAPKKVRLSIVANGWAIIVESLSDTPTPAGATAKTRAEAAPEQVIGFALLITHSQVVQLCGCGCFNAGRRTCYCTGWSVLLPSSYLGLIWRDGVACCVLALEHSRIASE
jgi:hypothetical protein